HGPSTPTRTSETRRAGPLFWEALPSGALAHDLPVWRAYTGQEEPLPTSGWLDGGVHPDDRAATTLAWAQAVGTGEPLSITHRLRGADGRYRTFLTQATPVLDDEGNVTRLRGVSCDLWEREREDGLAALQAQAFAATGDAVILTDGSGCITDWN